MSLLPGLREVRAATPAGRCPFCPQPCAPVSKRGGRVPTTCRSPVCKLREIRHYDRDYRRDEAKRNARVFA